MITRLHIDYRMVGLGLLTVIYVVGIVGLQTSSRAWFLAATPLTLALSTATMLVFHRDWRPIAVVGMVGMVLAGYGVEVLGVHTGWIFGDYWYGGALGPMVLSVPPLIGLNWLLLIYCSSSVASHWDWPWWAKAMVGASFMTLLDVLIEPVAMRLDFWQWAAGAPPLRNYLGWWLVAFVLSSLFHLLPIRKQNPVAAGLLVLQLLFFGMLNILD